MSEPKGYVRYHTLERRGAEREMKVDEIVRDIGFSTFDPREAFAFYDCVDRPDEIRISVDHPRIDLTLWPAEQDGMYSFRDGEKPGDGRFGHIERSNVDGFSRFFVCRSSSPVHGALGWHIGILKPSDEHQQT